jgi:hypothetical protein
MRTIFLSASPRLRASTRFLTTTFRPKRNSGSAIQINFGAFCMVDYSLNLNRCQPSGEGRGHLVQIDNAGMPGDKQLIGIGDQVTRIKVMIDTMHRNSGVFGLIVQQRPERVGPGIR